MKVFGNPRFVKILKKPAYINIGKHEAYENLGIRRPVECWKCGIFEACACEFFFGKSKNCEFFLENLSCEIL